MFGSVQNRGRVRKRTCKLRDLTQLRHVNIETGFIALLHLRTTFLNIGTIGHHL